MLLEIAQPISLLLCILSLFRVFHAAFLAPAVDWDQRIVHSLALLAVSACICAVSGLIFLEAGSAATVESTSLRSTLPVRLFFWSACGIVVLFLTCWYLETHFVLYRDVRRL